MSSHFVARVLAHGVFSHKTIHGALHTPRLTSRQVTNAFKPNGVAI